MTKAFLSLTIAALATITIGCGGGDSPALSDVTNLLTRNHESCREKSDGSTVRDLLRKWDDGYNDSNAELMFERMRSLPQDSVGVLTECRGSGVALGYVDESKEKVVTHVFLPSSSTNAEDFKELGVEVVLLEG